MNPLRLLLMSFWLFVLWSALFSLSSDSFVFLSFVFTFFNYFPLYFWSTIVLLSNCFIKLFRYICLSRILSKLLYLGTYLASNLTLTRFNSNTFKYRDKWADHRVHRLIIAKLALLFEATWQVGNKIFFINFCLNLCIPSSLCFSFNSLFFASKKGWKGEFMKNFGARVLNEKFHLPKKWFTGQPISLHSTQCDQIPE